jgi:hypothetical protein
MVALASKILKDEALETSILKEALLETVLALRFDYCLFNALNMKVFVNH